MADNELALKEQQKALVTMERDISDAVLGKIKTMTEGGDLALPPGYNAGTALKQAFLKIRETVDKNKKPALEVCTTDSISRALLGMCVQGLDPSKAQCYFIVHGNSLDLFRSYFGTQSALRRAVPSVYKIVADLAHEGDEFEWDTNQYGERYITRITTDPMKNASRPITFGYCNIYNREGELLGSTTMTWTQIQTSWKKTRSGGDTQKEFPEEMAKRTLIQRACKHILNSSIESNPIVVAAFNETTDNEYERVDLDKKEPEKKSLKDRYNIGKAEVVAEAEAQPVEEAKGPEVFEDSPFDTDSSPNSEDLFTGPDGEEIPF